jgi:hypothetical protein
MLFSLSTAVVAALVICDLACLNVSWKEECGASAVAMEFVVEENLSAIKLLA